jgi:hypothetical protein
MLRHGKDVDGRNSSAMTTTDSYLDSSCPKEGPFHELFQVNPHADQPKGELPRIPGQSERTW